MRSILIALVTVCASMSTVSAQTGRPSRIATVEDLAGVKTEVSELRASFDGREKFPGAYNCLSLTTPDYELAIPVDRLVSITTSGNVASIIVDWRGQRLTVSGILKGSLTGTSDFGDFALDAAKIKQLIFKSSPPRQSDTAIRSAQEGTVFLAAGRQIQLAGIQRHDRYSDYSPTAGFRPGAVVYMRHYDDFRFIRGESLATVQFTDLLRLEFEPEGSVTVNFKNGNRATGKLSDSNDAGVDGWTGEIGSGLVFVSQESVRAIAFGNTAAK